MLLFLTALLVIGAVDAASWKKPVQSVAPALPAVRPTVGAPMAPEPSDVCFQCRTRRNQKDMYADETDCHFYFQCFYFNETYATGIRRQCASGLFWHQDVLSCMPEGPVPCQDRCLDDVTSSAGCYAGTGCRQFFICSNSASYGMCCPEGSRFNETNCACTAEPSCTDPCIQEAPPVATTAEPPRTFNATVCRDPYGTFISLAEGDPASYVLLDEAGQATVKMACPELTEFDLALCRCLETGATKPPQVQLRQALVWIPFDTDTEDHSVNKFNTFLVNGAERDVSTSAQGVGSLRLDGGLLSIPGLKTFDLRNSASFCAFFKCNGGACSQSGGILSNYRNESDFTVVMATQPTNNFIGRLHFWHPAGVQSVNGPFQPPSNSWNHVCLTYDGNAIRLYLNGALADTQFIGGYLSISHCPYVVGNDPIFGSFIGNIDDVLITPFAMTQEEIEAHRTGNRAFLNSLGFGLGDSNLEAVRRPTRLSPKIQGDPPKLMKKFFVVPSFITWRQAGVICNSRAGRLAVITSAQERDQAINVMKAPLNSMFNTFWVGLSQSLNFETQEWQWVSGEPMAPGSGLWGQDEPSNRGFCGAFFGDWLGTANCEDHKVALCEGI